MLRVRKMQVECLLFRFSFLDRRCYRDQRSSCGCRSRRHCCLLLLLRCFGIKQTCSSWCCHYRPTKPHHISHRCSKLPNAEFRASIYTESSIWQPTSRLSSTRTTTTTKARLPTTTSLQCSLLIINTVLSLTFITDYSHSLGLCCYFYFISILSTFVIFSYSVYSINKMFV